LNQFDVVNGAIYLIAQTIVLRNKPTTIAMSSVCGLTLAHTADPVTVLRGAPDYIGAHRIKHAHNFYFIRV